MENNQKNNPNSTKGKSKEIILQYIVHQVEKGTGFSISDLKQKYSKERLFFIALKHVTTTKKALCTALDIPVEAACRYKRRLEKVGLLVQSSEEKICPLTRHPAHLLSTNDNEFESLISSPKNENTNENSN